MCSGSLPPVLPNCGCSAETLFPANRNPPENPPFFYILTMLNIDELLPVLCLIGKITKTIKICKTPASCLHSTKMAIFAKLPCKHVQRAKNGSYCNEYVPTSYNNEYFKKLAIADAL